MKNLRYSTLKAGLQQFAFRLWHDQKGAVAPLFLVSATVIFGVSLGAIDLARYTAAASRLQTSLDSAALAAGRLATVNPDANLLAEAQAYLDANFPPGYMGSNFDAGLSLTESANADGGTLTLTLNGTLPLVSTGFLKVSSMDLKGSSVVQLPGVSGIEVVFALDVGEHDSHTTLDTAAASLAELLMPEKGASSGIFIGLVPFSNVVNVGPSQNQSARLWVANWQGHWSGNPRVAASNPDYTSQVWRGCIAEPTPWLSPTVSDISALTPQARFQPVFVRVATDLNEKGTGPNWKGLPLNGLNQSENEQVAEGYSAGDLLTMTRNTAVGRQYDRRLWADFDNYGNGKGDAKFRVFGAFEPENCLSGYRARFLNDDAETIQNSLSVIASEPGFTGPPPKRRLRGDTVLPAGLFWSWRMLHPDWRGSDGWPVPSGLLSDSEQKRKVIVLFAGGNHASWDDLAAEPSGNPHNMEQWAEDDNNRSAFLLDYKVEQCANNGKDCVTPTNPMREHIQALFLPEKKKQQADDWQRPTTSVAMADPFSNVTTPNFSAWPSMADYTKAICSAIKRASDTPISIYVVDANAKANGTSSSAAASELIHCASEGKVYAASDVDMAKLRDRILQDVSTTSRLRLIR